MCSTREGIALHLLRIYQKGWEKIPDSDKCKFVLMQGFEELKREKETQLIFDHFFFYSYVMQVEWLASLVVSAMTTDEPRSVDHPQRDCCVRSGENNSWNVIESNYYLTIFEFFFTSFDCMHCNFV